MALLKYSNQLFLDKQELERQWQFIVDKGFKRTMLHNTYEFGVVRTVGDASFQSFRVESGTNVSTIKVPIDSFAVNSDGNVAFKASEDNIAIPNDSNWYWIRISHEYSPIEEGKVSVDTAGNMTGIGTKFKEVLRGQPNFPARITFSGASLNILEYDVVEVVNDTNAILSGVFSAESNLDYAVFGTFTPGHSPPSSDQYPFQYNSCQFDIILETVSGAPATTPGMDFLIARVRSVGGVLEIQDKRNEIWRTKADYEQTTVDKNDNPLLGVEEIRWDHLQGTKEKNQIKIGWGFRSSNFTYDSSLRKLTMNAGEGGKFKSTGDFTTGDFDGWIVYEKEGVWRKIVTSTKTGSDINLFLDVLDPEDNYTPTDDIVVVPDVEEVEFKFGPDAAGVVVEHTRSQVSSPVTDAYLLYWLLVPVAANSIYLYNIQWRYKRANEYSEWKLLPNDKQEGFYDESSFDAEGVLNASPLDRNRVGYSDTLMATDDDGYIPLIANAGNYYQFQQNITTGDLFGGSTITINNSNPIQTLVTGTSSIIQCVTGTITLSTNHVYNLDPTGAANGNEFTLVFDLNCTPAGYGITINTGYVNPGSPGTILHYFTPTDLDYMKMPRKKFVFHCRYVDTSWKGWIVEQDIDNLGDIKMFSNEVDLSPDVNFDATGRGVSDDYTGWCLCNGNNSTHDLRERFIAASNYITGAYPNAPSRDGDHDIITEAQFDVIGNYAAYHSYQQSVAQMPQHNHAGSTTGSKATGISLGNTDKHEYHASSTLGPGQSYFLKSGDNRGLFQRSTSHKHTVTDPKHFHSITITDQGTGTFIDNRPRYVILGFMQRVPYAGGAGGPGGSVTYPEPSL